ncbi:cylicin ii [Fusarium sporotrichioides]|uniref:Cylicin ii n=1 Tax=Fusarium sporotrichioides TaxID=5514 RepID=A0A395S2U2_FUSSP|nr:cylicin ii [Fusarium sporotrichioides]
MSSDPKPQARKRGRPANAFKSAATSASQDRPDEYEADSEEPVQPKQRGRPKKLVQEDATEETVAEEGKPRKKRGRPSLERNQDEQEPEPGAVENEVPQKRKRGRPALGKNKNDDAPEPEPAVEEEARATKKRGRAKKNQDVEEPEQQTAEKEKQFKRKRGRPSQEKDQNDKEPEQEVADSPEKPRRKKKTKGNPVEQPDEQQEEEPEPELEEAQPAPRKKRQRKASEPEPEEHEPEEDEQQIRRSPRNSLGNGRGDANKKGRKAEKSKKAARASQENAEDQQPDEITKKRGQRRGGKTQAEDADEPEPEPEQQGQEQDANKKKRRNKNDAPSDSDEALPSPPKPYLHIAPFKRTIRSSHIAAKWSPLTGSSLLAATSILTLAQRPVLQRTATTRNRRDHATAALNLVSRRIERKLDRGVPFPPASSTTSTRRRADADGGRAMELDFEAVLDGKQALERQLHPGKHAVELLKAERDRMEKELEKDYEVLRSLEANARAQTKERKDLFRKAHVLAPTSLPKNQGQDTQFVANKDEGSLKELLDTSLEPLALQLSGHVDSIRGNLQQAEGVTPQLNRTRAALQDVLQQYLDSDTYEQVLLG